MKTSIKIQNRLVGPDYSPLVFPEIGINHKGELDKAMAMIDSGAEVVKFKTHITDKEMIPTNMKLGDISDEILWDIIKKYELTEQEEISIQNHCIQKGLIYLSTPFSREAAGRFDEVISKKITKDLQIVPEDITGLN